MDVVGVGGRVAVAVGLGGELSVGRVHNYQGAEKF